MFHELANFYEKAAENLWNSHFIHTHMVSKQ